MATEVLTLATQDPAQPPPGPVYKFHLSRWDWLLLVAVLLFYAATRLYAVEDFPIYFFCDEAHQANQAHNLVANGFRDADGNLLPAYFRNVRVFNLGLSVWVHALTVTIFGKSILVVRATSVMIGLLGAAALMLALKWFYSVRLWWTGGLVMATLPAWFLHSRTAFETAMMVGFYATFVLAYLLYREVSARWLVAAVACGAATFYSYSNGQGVMLVTGVVLLVVDWRYHWLVLTRHRAAAAAALVVLVLAAGPYVRFRFFLHPEMMELHLNDLESYWVKDIPTPQKIATFTDTYLRGLSPGYWFVEDTTELARHRMLGYPHLPMWLAPAVLLGLGVSLVRSPRSAPHRLVLVGVLAAPFSASLVSLRITRVLAMMVPATLLATIGLDRLGSWLTRPLQRLSASARMATGRAFGAAVGIGLAAATFAMARDALVNGPLWFTNYGMHGMQWGAKELFTDLRRRIATAPGERFVVSHYWANNTDTFFDFFLEEKDRGRAKSGVIDDVLRRRDPDVLPTTVFVMTPDEFERARASRKLAMGERFSVIPAPDGRPAFYFTRLAYSNDADALFAAESEGRRRLVDDSVTVDGQAVRIRHPKLDLGTIDNAFDGNLKTLARTLDANPTSLELALPAPRRVSGVRLSLWTDHYHVNLQVLTVGGEIFEVEGDYLTGLPPEPIELVFPHPVPDVVGLRLHIFKAGDEHVHMREIEMLP